jgi:outer membrane lipoprotein-sorting protein
LQARVSWQRGKWTETQTWLIAPPARYTSLARIDTAPLPNTTASDGYTMWMDNPSRRTVTVYRRDPAGTWPSTESTLKRFTAYRSLSAILHDHCIPAHLDGTATVARRPAYVVTLGISRCPSPPDAGHYGPPPRWQPGKVVAWIDRQTMFALRTDVYFKARPNRVMLRDYVTSIRYNVPLSPRLFRLTVPRGYRLIHGH